MPSRLSLDEQWGEPVAVMLVVRTGADFFKQALRCGTSEFVGGLFDGREWSSVGAAELYDGVAV